MPPDEGATGTLMQQGLAIGMVIAVVPLVVIFGSGDPSRVAMLGGAMTAAGFATMFGGNFAGLAMAIGGVPILVSAASRGVQLSPGYVDGLVGYTALLVAAM